MRIEQWMTVNPLTVRPQDSVAHARALLKEHRINQLPVTLDGALVGIVTDRDLRDAMGTLYAAAAASENPPPPERRAAQVIAEDIAVEAVMTANAITIEPYDTMERAAVVMRRERIGALPVVHRGELRGIVTRTDVLRAYLALASYDRKAKIGHAWKGPYSNPDPPRFVPR
jgi:acetoin utilization protein AcuB